MTVPVGADGALGLYSAVGDAFAERPLGFGRRRAALAARFARFRGAADDAVAAAWIAGALADVGLVAVVVPEDAPARARAHAVADAPLHGARIVAALRGVPPETADIVRWHREHDDGTGAPDGLRWDGIPAAAAALGIVHAYLAAVHDPVEPRDPFEAQFALAADAGRRFGIDLVRAFREFIAGAPDDAAPPELRLRPIDEDGALTTLIERIDARDESTRGLSARLAARASALAQRVGLDGDRAARCARLLALGRAAPAVPHDAYDPFSRFARAERTRTAQRAAALAASVPRYAGDAPALADSAAWFEDGAGDPYGAVLAVTVAADTLDPLAAPRRLAGAAGTQLDPDVTRAYLAGLGAAT